MMLTRAEVLVPARKVLVYLLSLPSVQGELDLQWILG